MRPLLLLAAVLFAPVAWAQGVSRSSPSLEDLAVLFGDVVTIDLEVPEGATLVRFSFGVGADRAELHLSLDHGGRREPPPELRLLVHVPALRGGYDVSGQAVNVHVLDPDGSTSSLGPFDVPREGGRRHELVVERATLELGAWAPLYIRAWTPSETGNETVDLERAFVAQVWMGTGDAETVDPGPPLDVEALAQMGAVRNFLTLEPPRP